MTERLYYTQPCLARFEAQVAERSEDGTRVVLDRTAFYPDSGGQPADQGTLGGVPVVAVAEDEASGGIVHVLDRALPVTPRVEGVIDWARRFDHMQQHSGQHLLSAVFEELCRAKTVSFHLGAESSTIDLEIAAFGPEQIAAVERRSNEVVFENRAVTVAFEEAAAAEGLRKPSEREGRIRVVSIDGLDRSACGGTHVQRTGEIGPVLIRKLDKIRGNVRVEFLCGMRAANRARQDLDALARIARLFSSSLDEAPALAAAALEQSKETEKARRKLALEVAAYRGRELHAATPAGAGGLRRAVEERGSGGIDDESRALAQNYCAQPGGVFICICQDPPSLLLAVSSDTGLNAGSLLKEAVTAEGGRGGGNSQIAQGSLPDRDALARAADRLREI